MVDAEPSGLIGRDQELSAIDAMLRGGGECGLLLVGEAGMGKSALLDAASTAATRNGRTVLRATGVHSEARVAFAGLHQLLYRLTGSFELLAPGQRQALLAAFGHADGPPTEVFLIAIATLELLADAATGTGVLVVVDDLQWIDEPTAQVLGFVARRIASEPISLLAAMRPGFEDALGESGVLVRTLRPLRSEEAERLVRSRHPDLDQRRREWVLEHAEGNPLALVELPKAAPAGHPGAAGRIPLTARLERSFAARVSGLTAPARSAVVVAAADDSDGFAEIAAAVTAAVPGSAAGRTSVAAWEQAAALTPQTGRRGQRLLRAAELSLELGRAEQAGDLGARAEPLPHTRADQARLALIRDVLDPGVPGDPLRVRALADLAAEMIDAGHIDLAFRLLMAAAVRVWAADPGPETRAYLMAATERLPVPADDPRLLSVGGFVDPARYGDLIAQRITALRPGELDPLSAELAMSIHLVGAGEAIIAVQRVVVDGVRREGRLAALPRLLTQQAWNAIALADWQTAVPLADEAVRLADEMRQPLWQAAAMTGQAMIAGMRGEAEAAGQLARRAEAMVLPRGSARCCAASSSRSASPRSAPDVMTRRSIICAGCSIAPIPRTRPCRVPGHSATWLRPPCAPGGPPRRGRSWP
jgi:AAA ATPase domain